MALRSNSHRSLTECDSAPVFICITTTVSKKGMAKKTEGAKRENEWTGKDKLRHVIRTHL